MGWSRKPATLRRPNHCGGTIPATRRRRVDDGRLPRIAVAHPTRRARRVLIWRSAGAASTEWTRDRWPCAMNGVKPPGTDDASVSAAGEVVAVHGERVIVVEGDRARV